MNLWSDDNASMMEAFMASTDLHSFPSWAPSPAPVTQAALAAPSAAYLNQETLQHRLQSLIEGAREAWTYAIFWQSNVDVAADLSWGDGYYKGNEEKRKANFSASSASDQENRKRVLRELNSLISGGGSPDENIDEEVTDTEWFFLVSMTQSFVSGAGLPGQALYSNLPQWIDGADKLAAVQCERARQAAQFGMQTMVVVPVGSGVLELGSTDLIFQSHRIMSKIKHLFSFNGGGRGGGGGDEGRGGGEGGGGELSFFSNAFSPSFSSDVADLLFSVNCKTSRQPVCVSQFLPELNHQPHTLAASNHRPGELTPQFHRRFLHKIQTKSERVRALSGELGVTGSSLSLSS